jgi:Skp family chaperone for outer membrane proteins
MKNTCIAVFVLLVIAGTQAYGQSAIGFVDFNSVFMLHPQMGDYSPTERAFKVTLSKAQAAKSSQRKKEVNAQVTALRSQNKATEARMIELRRQYEKDLDVLISNFNKKTQGKLSPQELAYETQSYNIKRDSLEEKFRSEIAMVHQILAGGMDRLEKLEYFISNEGYTDYDETIDKLNDIVKEIQDAILKVSKKHKMQIVLNSSASRLLQETRKQDANIFSTSFSYKEILNSKHLPPHEEEFDFDESVASFYAHIIDSAKAWLTNERDVIANFANVVPQGNVIIGGSDITSEVLLELFKKHKVADNTAKAISSIFTEKK